MRRILLTVILALSVAVTPAVGYAVLAIHALNPSPASATSHHDMVHAADMAECCPDQAKLTDKTAGEQDCMGICALMYLNYADTSVANLVFLLQADSVQPLTAQPPRPQTGHPPFRPPRV